MIRLRGRGPAAKLILGLVLGLALPNATRAVEYVMGVPPVITAEMEEAFFDAVDQLAELVGPGDGLTLVGLGTDPEIVERLAITEERDARRRREAAAFKGVLDEYLQGRVLGEGQEDDPALFEVPINAEVIGTELMTQALGSTDPNTRTVCVFWPGDPRSHHEDAFEAFSMREGLFPSDGMILGSSTESPYGTADHQGLQRGVNVHVWWFGAPWDSDLHRARVQRFWAGYYDAQGGTLATFTSSLDVALERWMNCAAKPVEAFHWDSTRNAFAMIGFGRAELVEDGVIKLSPLPPQEPAREPVELPAAEPLLEPEPRVAEIPTAPAPEEAPPAAMPLRASLANDDWLLVDDPVATEGPPEVEGGAVKLGLRWSAEGCEPGTTLDLDLYVRESPTEPFLFWNETLTSEGRFGKQGLDSGDASALGNDRGLEEVELHDVARFADLSMLVNAYQATCPSGAIRAEVRAYHDGATWMLPITVKTGSGTYGRGLKSPEDDPAWVVVDPRALFRITE